LGILWRITCFKLKLHFQVNPKQAVPITPERQRMIDFILSYTNDRPSFGDAATWQNQERSERELPWQV
jgi:hypothetical protein